MQIPESYIIEKFNTYNYRPKYNRHNNTYQAGCGICREGKSLKTKRRCFYIPKSNTIFCHNCGWSSNTLNWILHVTGKSFKDIANEVKEFVPDLEDILKENKDIPVDIECKTLPDNSINIFDESQVEYYKTNRILLKALKIVNDRRINSAINKPKQLYLSLTDRDHKNRLVIPFRDFEGNIVFFQSRSITKHDLDNKAKYISNIGAQKTLYGVDQLDYGIDTVYIFEGPINSFFCKNGIAVGGITKGDFMLTSKQQQQMTALKGMFKKFIWCLDSQWIDQTALDKSIKLLETGNKVFVWPKKYGTKFKDFNDICISNKINEIGHAFIQKNTFEGVEGILKLSECKPD